MRELRKAIDSYLKKDDIPSDFNNITSSPLITELSEQDGILQKLHENSDEYLFLHRTFQEYFTACYLQRSSNGIELAKAHFWDYEWHETLTLMVGLMANPVTLLQTIKNEKDDIFQTLLLLAGRCTVESKESKHQLVQKIINDIHGFWLIYPKAEFITSVVVMLGQTYLQMMSHLEADLNHAEWSVRSYAAYALGKIGSDKAVDVLITALNHADSDVRSSAALALGNIGSYKAVLALITALDHAETDVRSRAAEALGNFVSGKVVDPLITAFNHAELIVRLGASHAFEKIGSDKSVDALIMALNHGDLDVKSSAAEVLGKIGSDKAVDALITALNDAEWIVIFSVAQALEKIGKLEILAKLIEKYEILNDNNKYDKFILARKLAVRFSKEKVPFIPVYQELLGQSFDV